MPALTLLPKRTFTSTCAGHQLQPRKALALLGGRGWVSHPEEGVRRTFHEADLTVALGFLNGWGSPVEVEAPTLEEVRFYPRGEWTPIPIADVPRRLFSEAMRDLDLVVRSRRRATFSASINGRVEASWALVDGTSASIQSISAAPSSTDDPAVPFASCRCTASIEAASSSTIVEQIRS